MDTETEIYQILRKHRLSLKKREDVIVDLLVFINKRDKQLRIGSVSNCFSKEDMVKEYNKGLRAGVKLEQPH